MVAQVLKYEQEVNRLFTEYARIIASNLEEKQINQRVDMWLAKELMHLMNSMLNPKNRIIVTRAIEFVLALKTGGLVFQQVEREYLGSKDGKDLDHETKHHLLRQLKEVWEHPPHFREN